MSKDEQLREKDAIIKKLADHQEIQDDVIKKQMELLEDMHQHQEKHEQLDKVLVNNVVKEQQIKMESELVQDNRNVPVQNEAAKHNDGPDGRLDDRMNARAIGNQGQKVDQLRDVARSDGGVGHNVPSMRKQRNSVQAIKPVDIKNIDAAKVAPVGLEDVKRENAPLFELNSNMNEQPAGDVAHPVDNAVVNDQSKNEVVINAENVKSRETLKRRDILDRGELVGGNDERRENNINDVAEVAKAMTPSVLKTAKASENPKMTEQEGVKMPVLKNEMRKLNDDIPNGGRAI